MKFSFRALVWFLGSAGVFCVLLQFESKTDLLVRALIWGYVAAVSVVMLVLALYRGGPVSPDAALPDRLRRWMYGESDENRGRHS